MSRLRISIFIGMAAYLALSACATVSQPVYKGCTAKEVKDGKCSRVDGVPYVLPRTALKITIPITEKNEVEGKFVSDAKEIFAKNNNCSWDGNNKDIDQCSTKKPSFNDMFKDQDKCISLVRMKADALGVKIALNDPNDSSRVYPKKTYKLGEISVSAVAEPDPDQLYFVEVSGGRFETRNIDISFAPSGILNDITMGAEDKTVEFATKTFGSVLGAATKIGLGFAGVGCTTNEKEESLPECVGSIYRDLVRRAKATLEFIDSFPAKRMDELKGTNNTAQGAKENLELRLKELDKIYTDALAVFEVNTKTETKSYEISLIPTKNNSTIPMATFNETCGIYRTVQLDGTMPSSNVPLLDNKQCKPTDPANIQAIFAPPPHLTETTLAKHVIDSLNVTDSLRGIYYRIPETSRFRIINGENENKAKELLVKDLAIAQFGSTASLPAETGSVNVVYKVTLDPVTGMLLKVAITSTAAGTDTAKNIVDPVGDYLKARKDSKDELTQLQREESLLKVKKSIKDLKEALGQ